MQRWPSVRLLSSWPYFVCLRAKHPLQSWTPFFTVPDPSTCPASSEGHLNLSPVSLNSSPQANGDIGPQPPRPGSTNYYLNLAQELLINSRSANDAGLPDVPGGYSPATTLRELIANRSNATLGDVFSRVSWAHWLAFIDIYEDEIALMYPFLNLENLRYSASPASQGGPVNVGAIGLDGQRWIPDGHIEVMLLLLVVVAVLEDPEVSKISDGFTEDIMMNTRRRTYAGDVGEHDIELNILISIYYFMTDRETLAWRTVGHVVRMLQELGYHNSSNLQQRFRSDEAKRRAKKVFWSAYMLDRRWSFGTGLPFGILDSDIDYDVDVMDDTLPSAYLKAMVAYCRIASEVRDSGLGTVSTSPVKDAARDLADFRIVEWRRNLPCGLHFTPDEKFDPMKESRGQYRLRLVLYLRANQMRTVIHRKSALRSGTGHINTSSVNAMVGVAQDTIRILADLVKTSNIYQTQQKTFNHFLESALSSLLLITCCSKSSVDRSCLKEVKLAMSLVQMLSSTSSITRRLRDRLQFVAGIDTEDMENVMLASGVGSSVARPLGVDAHSSTQDMPSPSTNRTSASVASVETRNGSTRVTQDQHSGNSRPLLFNEGNPDPNYGRIGRYTPPALDVDVVSMAPLSEGFMPLGMDSTYPMGLAFPDGSEASIANLPDTFFENLGEDLTEILTDYDRLFAF
ncbi:uncharacterized protein JN550_000466 [Neoarthrinium moseri]|uniref:uncharacterized protein n=1 Tax=Neoarthrinium moseri TaxID=1658444 RepID=UPI001FDE54EB|nr:uncharacterized protein JN550_000466 [Neoarthrinium moseri]KAI1878284.1 hypothetical protein JN550_000466 [Neoarthrinium moseri]